MSRLRWRGRRWRSPGSRAKVFCACQGPRRRGASICLAISTRAVLPSVGRKTSAPRTCLAPLNTSPAYSPVNASRLPSWTARASLGAGVGRYAFTVTNLHRLLLPVSRAPVYFIKVGHVAKLRAVPSSSRRGPVGFSVSGLQSAVCRIGRLAERGRSVHIDYRGEIAF